MGRHKAQRRRDNTRNRHQQRELMRRAETVREHVKETGDSHGCYEKLRYDSLAEAKRAADGSAAAYACQMGVYRCHVCHGYHVTHKITGHLLYVAEPPEQKPSRRRVSDVERVRWMIDGKDTLLGEHLRGGYAVGVGDAVVLDACRRPVVLFLAAPVMQLGPVVRVAYHHVNVCALLLEESV